jgi:hypothetical protein
MAKKKRAARKRTRPPGKKSDPKYSYGGSAPVTWVRVPLINPWWWVSWFEEEYPSKKYQDPMQYKSR